MESPLDGPPPQGFGYATSPSPIGSVDGDALAMLLVRSGLGGAGAFAVRGTAARLGRAPHNDVVLVSPSVGAEHAELRLHDGIWSLSDLGSPTGSMVDGVAVDGTSPLAPGSELRVGHVTLVFDPRDRWDDSPQPVAPVVETIAVEAPVVVEADPVADEPPVVVEAPAPSAAHRDDVLSMVEARYREASSPFLVLPESEPRPRRWWLIAIGLVAAAAVAYFLFQAR